MARSRKVKDQIPTYQLPTFVLIPVEEDMISASERRASVTDLIARLSIGSKKRGRPKKNLEEEQDHAA